MRSQSQRGRLFKGPAGVRMSPLTASTARTRAARYANLTNARFGGAAYTTGPATFRGLNRRGVASKETGFVDTALASYNMDTTGSIALIPTIAQGASVNQRIGKKIVLKSLQARGQVFNGATGSINDVAFLIVYDKRPTGALPAITDILVTATAAAMNNDANSGRFQILKRCDFLLVGNITGTPATQSLTETSALSADFFLDLKMKPEVFKAAGTGAIGDIEEGALYIVTVGSIAAGTAAATLSMAFRTRFVDV